MRRKQERQERQTKKQINRKGTTAFKADTHKQNTTERKKNRITAKKAP